MGRGTTGKFNQFWVGFGNPNVHFTKTEIENGDSAKLHKGNSYQCHQGNETKKIEGNETSYVYGFSYKTEIGGSQKISVGFDTKISAGFDIAVKASVAFEAKLSRSVVFKNTDEYVKCKEGMKWKSAVDQEKKEKQERFLDGLFEIIGSMNTRARELSLEVKKLDEKLGAVRREAEAMTQKIRIKYVVEAPVIQFRNASTYMTMLQSWGRIGLGGEVLLFNGKKIQLG